jgi:hypothetical protein
MARPEEKRREKGTAKMIEPNNRKQLTGPAF